MIEPFAGPWFVPAVLGTAAVPLVHVRFSQGRFEDWPSEEVNVMILAPLDHEVISLEA